MYEMHYSLVVLLILLSRLSVSGAKECFERGACSNCLVSNNQTGSEQCDWIPDRYSCAPRTGEDDFLSGLRREQNSCDSHKKITVPPNEFRHVCGNGGVYSTDPSKPFGAYCDCPHKLIGSKCQVCNSRSTCPSNHHCKQNIRHVQPGEVRYLSCDCDSDLCKKIGFGPGMGVVNVEIHFGKDKTDTFARIDILKGVDVPKDLMKSPYIIQANLTECSPGKDVPCSQFCGIMGCPKGVPWTADDTCRFWTCETTGKSPTQYTICPPTDKPWTQYPNECSMVQQMMRPNFQFVCVVPKEPDAPLVDGRVRCGFSTYILSHGSIALDCSVGACVENEHTEAPTALPSNKSDDDVPHKRGGIESLFVCSGHIGDQDCWNTYYFLILLVPSMYSMTVVFYVFLRQREVRAAVHATRILRSHLLDGLSDDESNPPSLTATTTTTNNNNNSAYADISPSRDQESGLIQFGTDEESSMRQAREPLIRQPARLPVVLAPNKLPSPIISFHDISFGIYDHSRPEDVQGRIRSGFIRTKVKGFRTVLHSVSGHVRSGELCAIMGPSGSGKTSLIDILAGRKNQGKIAGTVSFDGMQMTPEKLRDAVGYVTQDDVLPSTSTVRELLLFNASLRGNSTMPLLTRCERVQDVLEELGLVHCADAVIGGPDRKSISGGERRRVSIACELLGEHTRVLVMDEPTSGLDSNSTTSVINALQTVVDTEKKTVILSIHQPSSVLFKKFSRVLLLSSTGRCLFCGPNESLERFFPPVPVGANPAEYLIDLCVGNSDEDFRQAEERFNSSSVKAEQLQELRQLLDQQAAITSVLRDQHFSIHRPTMRRQVSELSVRAVTQAWRHPVLAMTNVVATVCVGLLCGLLYRGVTNDLQGAINRAGLFFFFLCFLMLASVADLGVFQEERLVLMREKASNAYSGIAWFISKVFVEILLLRTVPLVFTTFVLTGLVGLNQHPHTVFFMFILLLLISITATLQFLCLGMIFTQNGVANFGAILLTMFSLLMSGFLLQFDGTGGGNGAENDPPKTSGFEWLQSFSVLHFGFEALMVNELHGLNFEVIIRAPDGAEVTRVAASGELILAQLGFLYENFKSDVGVVITFFLVFSLVCVILLKVAVVERR